VKKLRETKQKKISAPVRTEQNRMHPGRKHRKRSALSPENKKK
jgi:hypothetical protein